MSNYVKILDKITLEVLYQTSLDNIDSAYHYAQVLEENDVDFIFNIPSLPESLGIALGHPPEEIDQLKDALCTEIESHNK